MINDLRAYFGILARRIAFPGFNQCEPGSPGSPGRTRDPTGPDRPARESGGRVCGGGGGWQRVAVSTAEASDPRLDPDDHHRPGQAPRAQAERQGLLGGHEHALLLNIALERVQGRLDALSDVPREHGRHRVPDHPLRLPEPGLELEGVRERLEACRLPHRDAAGQAVMERVVAVALGTDRRGRLGRVKRATALLSGPLGQGPDVAELGVLRGFLQVLDGLLRGDPGALGRRGLRARELRRTVQNAHDQHPLSALRDPVVRGQVELVGHIVSQFGEVLYDGFEALAVIAIQQSADVLRDEHLRAHPAGRFDHRPIQAGPLTRDAAPLAIDRYVLTGESSDQQVAGVRHRVDVVPHTPDVNRMPQVMHIGRAGIRVQVVRPDDVERVVLEAFTQIFEAAHQAQVHPAAPRKH